MVGNDNNNFTFMDNSINYPKSVTEKKIVEDFIAVAKRFKLSQATIDAIYKDLNSEPPLTYPDGT